VVIKYAAQNQLVRGILVRWRIVPDVSETWWRHLQHCWRLWFTNS
jgi:hypothetical protein